MWFPETNTSEKFNLRMSSFNSMRSKLRKFGFSLILVVFALLPRSSSASLLSRFIMSSATASIFPQGNGLQPRGTLTSKWLGRRQGVKAAAMEIALSLIPIWHSCRRLWDPVVSVMPTARVCSVKSFPTGHGLEPVLYLSPVALSPLSLSGMTEKIESPLERILNAEFTGDRFDRFIVLNGGRGAWKQPNQYIFWTLRGHSYRSHHLDGFNEHYMINSRRRFEELCQPLFPSR